MQHRGADGSPSRRSCGIGGSVAVAAARADRGGEPAARRGQRCATAVGARSQASLGRRGRADLRVAGLRRERRDRPDRRLGHPFEKADRLQGHRQGLRDSDEAFSADSTNPEQYDVISASGDASLRLVAGGYVQPVNIDLVPNYADIFEGLKNKPYNTVDGVHYGVPHGRGANLLMWRHRRRTTAPDSWAVCSTPTSPYEGKVTVYDAPIYIADAAVVPDGDQARARHQEPVRPRRRPSSRPPSTCSSSRSRSSASTGSTTHEADRRASRNGDMSIGTTWQSSANLLRRRAAASRSRSIKPKEGATGWSDTWMINSKAKHPNCMYKWIDHIVSPEVNAADRRWFGEAPGNPKACARDRTKLCRPLRPSTPTDDAF